MGSDGTVGANKEAVKIIASQEGMHAQVRPAPPACAAAMYVAQAHGQQRRMATPLPN